MPSPVALPAVPWSELLLRMPEVGLAPDRVSDRSGICGMMASATTAVSRGNPLPNFAVNQDVGATGNIACDFLGRQTARVILS